MGNRTSPCSFVFSEPQFLICEWVYHTCVRELCGINESMSRTELHVSQLVVGTCLHFLVSFPPGFYIGVCRQRFWFTMHRLDYQLQSFISRTALSKEHNQSQPQRQPLFYNVLILVMNIDKWHNNSSYLVGSL